MVGWLIQFKKMNWHFSITKPTALERKIDGLRPNTGWNSNHIKEPKEQINKKEEQFTYSQDLLSLLTSVTSTVQK